MKKIIKLYASLSADIVDSTSLSVRDLKHLREEILNILMHLDKSVAPVWGRVVRGDTLECITSHPSYILRIALALKCYLKYWLSTVDSSAQSRIYTLRYSIGIGTMREVDFEEGFLDGPAIYMSGRNLDQMSPNRFAAFDCETDCADFVGLLDVNLCLLDALINDLSAKQAIVVYYKLLSVSEVVIAREMGISQAAVNYRSTSAHWSLINRTIEHFESLNFEEYVR